jgi:predicted RNA binding protein YcfA (HicA-like mRNA interferase family)
MGRFFVLITRILSGNADAAINFNDLCNLLIAMGFEMRIKGSHHLFRKDDIKEMINLQKDGSQAKPYQVKQVRNLILKYKLGEQLHE